MAGNAPLNTSPVYIADEHLWVRARGDYITLATASEQLAFGTDGAFAPSAQWALTSATIDFQSQGVSPRNVVWLTGTSTPVKTAFPGGGRAFAVDTVVGNTITLRLPMNNPGVGQPPAPIAGLTGVIFTINTFAALIEDVSFDIKSRFGLDEAMTYRSSSWIYQGAEDLYRDLRAVVVLQVLKKAYAAELRSNKGDWFEKLKRIECEYDGILDRVQIRFGPVGNSSESTTVFSCKISR